MDTSVTLAYVLGPGLASQLCTRHSRPRPRHSALSWSGAAQGGRRDAGALTLTSIHLKCVEYQTVVTLAFCVIHSQWKYQECCVVERTQSSAQGDYYGFMVMMTYDKCWKVSASFPNVNICIRRDYIIRRLARCQQLYDASSRGLFIPRTMLCLKMAAEQRCYSFCSGDRVSLGPIF